MIVVSNTSPLMNLAAVGQLDLLELLYGKVLVPEAVLQELSVVSDQFGAEEIRRFSWLETRSTTNRPLLDSLLLELDKGEAEAIALAMEVGADVLLLDERLARRVASRLGLKFVGVLGVLVHAKDKGFLAAIKPVLDALAAKAGFWLSRELYARVLQAAGEWQY